jgi:hypothetical protein
MIDREYLVRQATILLRMARTVHDPAVSGRLAAKAADLKMKLDDGPVDQGLPIGPTESAAADGKETH